MNTNLYQDIILDHYHHPRHHGTLPDATHHADGINSSCGDKLHIDIQVEDGTIKTIRWSGIGCAISQAGASLLAEHIQGQSVEQARALRPEDVLRLIGVPLSPSRMKCGLLSLETLHQTLIDREKIV